MNKIDKHIEVKNDNQNTSEENIKIMIYNPNINNIRYNLNYFFDKIFIINLNKCVGRWNKIVKNLSKLGIYNFERQAGIYLPRVDATQYLNPILYKNLEAYGGKFKYDNNYILNCVGTNLSHFSIIKKAKERRYKRILILEDDIFFNKKALHKFYQIGDFLEHNYWDFLYLGYKKCSVKIKKKNINKNLSKVNGLLRGAYGYALNHTCYDFILNNYLFNGIEVDAFYEFVLCKHYQCFMINSPIIHHRDNMNSTITIGKWAGREY